MGKATKLVAPTTQSIGFIVKSTRRCNLRCRYCHDWRSHASSMPFETLLQLTSKSLTSKAARRIDYMWHGGEPLLMGRSFYEKALALQNHFAKSNQIITNSIQTNGTLLDDSWCEFISEYGFSVGISVDGPAIIHDSTRRDSAGRGSLKKVMRGIQKLRDAKIHFGVLTVLTNDVLELGPSALFGFLVDDLGVDSFSLLPARPDNVPGTGERPTNDYVDNRAYANFMTKMFDLWLERDDPKINIRELTSLTRVILGGLPTVCTLAGGCIGSYFHVEYNGDLWHCDKYLGDDEYRIGNIVDTDLDAILVGSRLQSLAHQESKAHSSLSTCEYYGVCNGGCPHDRYEIMRFSGSSSISCCGLNALIAHIETRLWEVDGVQRLLTATPDREQNRRTYISDNNSQRPIL